MYQVSTLKKRPGVVSKINLGEMRVEVRLNTKKDMEELLQLTRRVAVAVKEYLGEELLLFDSILWYGPITPEEEPHLIRLWPKLDDHSKKNILAEALALEAGAHDEDPRMRREVAACFKTPKSLLEKLLQDKEESVRLTVLHNTITPPDLLAKAYELYKDDRSVLLAIAHHLKAPPSVLRELAFYPDWQVRGAVAFNKNTPTEILDNLAESPYDKVACGVASNRNATPAILHKLFQNRRASLIKYHLASNPRLPEELQKALSQDADYVVRLRLAANPGVSSQILKSLLRDPAPGVRAQARYALGASL